MENWKRRRWVVSKRFQYSVIFFLVFWTCFLLAILYVMMSDVTSALYLFLPDTTQGTLLRQTVEQKVHLILFSVAVGMFLIDLLIGVYSLQKIVGPLHRFHQHLLADAKAGRLSALHFRKGDQLQEKVHPESGAPPK
jgi:hypothetical protein